VTIVYDAGALIAADRSDRQLWADHRARLELGMAPVTTAPVVAQASRSSRQVQLRRFLRGCVTVDFSGQDAHEVGALAGASGCSDVVDVHVIVVANRHHVGVLTSDPDDLNRIAGALATSVPVTLV
jgi:hypothetical protein